MSKSTFLDALASGRLLFLDGAMGTMLQAAGMPPGTSPEKFCLANPDILKKIHLAYLAAGSNIITTCTFGANPFKMPKDMEVRDFNRRMATIARQAVAESGRDGPLFVAGNVGPCGLFAKPLGNLDPEEMINGFSSQIAGLAEGGVDVIFMETQFDVAETRAAVVAAARTCNLPVMASMTFEHGTSLTGSSPEIFAATMQNLGCAVIGTNCSLGPDEMKPVVEELLSSTPKPILAEPNAGLPELVNGQTVFPLPPEPFAQKTARFAQLGAQILGGCCGTTPDHIRALVAACASIDRPMEARSPHPGIALTSRSNIVRIGAAQPLALIGERINPTGKPKLKEQLQKGEFTEALRLADEQIEAGASVLDVNVGAPLVNEATLMPRLVSLLVSRQLAPLSLDSSQTEAIKAALPWCPGSCLVNSISGEADSMAKRGPLCRDFGAPFILLPLAGKELPVKASQRIRIIKTLLAQADELAIPRYLILVDILALAVSSSQDAVKESLRTLDWCKEHNLPTTLGLSNISFGLPARDLLNATFLCMARGGGLASCIANPGAPRISEAMAAMNVLLGYDRDAQSFINRFKEWKHEGHTQATEKSSGKIPETLHDAVLTGDRENVMAILEKDLEAGQNPMQIVNDVLIPAITEVGARYERREYFLPQLIRSAETMQLAFKRLKPLLEEKGDAHKKPAVIMATVEGDIHDIGKNIVCLLLGNHGFEVIDAGKDVPAEKIIELALQHNARIIGLSALMTTTMVRMEDTIKLVRERDLPIKIMVGGAAVTQDFANSIGADAYCEDAVAGVAAARAFIDAI